MMELSGESRYVNVDGIDTHYVAAGEGPPLLLFHGLGASVATWRDNIGPLSEAFRVYAIDLPGHGDSSKPDIDYFPHSMADFAKNLIDELGLERPAIIGNSVGGALALMVAQKYPEAVSRLVLVCSAGLGKEISIYLRLASVPLLGDLMESSKVSGMRFMLCNVFHDSSFVTQELLEELYRSRQMPGAKNVVLRVIRHAVNLAGVRKDYILTKHLSCLKIPIMVVWGAQDQILPVSHAYGVLKTASQVQLQVFDGCGHWPHMEKADAFNSLVLKFLSQSHLSVEQPSG
jgi:pimeloyl-ACP methyl ester carboxylesterase